MRGWPRRREILAGVVAGAAALAKGAAAETRLDPLLTGLLSDGENGVVSAGVILRDGNGVIAAAGAAGRRMVPNSTTMQWRPFSLDAPFRVASVSKMIAAVGFMRLVEQGRATLDDDVSLHLGFRLRHPAFPDQAITARQLLSHTSSLRNGPSYPVPASHALREAFEVGGRHYDGGAWFGPPDRAPGSWFAYADVNFCLVAQMIERISGERFAHYMSDAVLTPLGLDAGYNWSGVSASKRLEAAPALRWRTGAWSAEIDGVVPAAPAASFPQPHDAAPVDEADLPLGVNGFLFSPQGGLRVSLNDMDRLAGFFSTGGRVGARHILDASTLNAMQVPVWIYNHETPNGDPAEGYGIASIFGGYGLGVEIPQGSTASAGDAFFGSSSPQWRGHLGDAYGWMTGLFWNRTTGQTLVYAVNGMRETGRPSGRRSALTAPEEEVITLALGLS